jgi:hypothetical protein
MHAVVTTATLHDFERARAFLTEQLAPAVRQAPGFVSGQWVRVGENAGTGVITFESEDAARRGAEYLRSNPPPADVVTVNSIETGEVVERM